MGSRPTGLGAQDINEFTEIYPEWVWQYWMHTGDRALLDAVYPVLVNVAEYVAGAIDPSTGLVNDLLSTDTYYAFPIATRINVLGVNVFRRAGDAAAALGRPASEVNRQRRAQAQLTSAINRHLTRGDGTYVDGTRQASFVIADGMTVMLGETDGIPVTFAFDDASERTAALTSGPMISDEERTHWVPEGETDEGIARAGTAVAARREQLGIAQRSLARNKIMNAGALIAFEKGRSWPRKQTLAKLEDVLQWPPGMISRIRYGATSPYDEATEALSNSIRAPLMAQTIELALSTLGSTIAALPDPADTDFGPRVGAVLADLRRLESMAANAARSARGAPEIAIALSTVRKRYDELMLRAARSPKATLGQRLYAARRRAELTVEEVANATGLSVALITGAEADGPIGPSTAATLESFIGMLAAR